MTSSAGGRHRPVAAAAALKADSPARSAPTDRHTADRFDRAERAGDELAPMTSLREPAEPQLRHGKGIKEVSFIALRCWLGTRSGENTSQHCAAVDETSSPTDARIKDDIKVISDISDVPRRLVM